MSGTKDVVLEVGIIKLNIKTPFILFFIKLFYFVFYSVVLKVGKLTNKFLF